MAKKKRKFKSPLTATGWVMGSAKGLMTIRKNRALKAMGLKKR